MFVAAFAWNLREDLRPATWDAAPPAPAGVPVSHLVTVLTAGVFLVLVAIVAVSDPATSPVVAGAALAGAAGSTVFAARARRWEAAHGEALLAAGRVRGWTFYRGDAAE